LRRVMEPVIHVINVQHASGLEYRFYVNLGSHLRFLPPEGQAEATDAIKEYDCAFRDRLDPPGSPGTPWIYAQATLPVLLGCWTEHGRAWFRKDTDYPDDFEKLVSEALTNPPHPYEALAIARIAAHLGHEDQSHAIARTALDATDSSASTLRARLRRLIKTLR
jgi:hypothetical protein